MTAETTKCVSEQFFPKDWLSDSALRSADPATRGAWMDCLCHMWLNRVGRLTGTTASFAVMWGSSKREAARILGAMKASKICNVTESSGSVTLVSRRLSRRCKSREQTALRMQRLRERKQCDAGVTPVESLLPLTTTTNDVPTNTNDCQKNDVNDVTATDRLSLRGVVSLNGVNGNGAQPSVPSPVASTSPAAPTAAPVEQDSEPLAWADGAWAAVERWARQNGITVRRLGKDRPTLTKYDPADVLGTLMHIQTKPDYRDENDFMRRLMHRLPLLRPPPGTKPYYLPDRFRDEAKREIQSIAKRRQWAATGG